MEIEYHIAESDYLNFYKSFFKSAFRKRAVFIFLIPFLIAMGVSDGEPRHYLIFIISLLVGVLITTTIYIFIPYTIAKGNLKKMSSEQGVFWLQPGVLSTSENGLMLIRKVQGKESVYEIKWIHIESFDTDKQSIIIRRVDKKYFLVPRRFFSSEGEILDFQGIMQTEIRKARGLRNREFTGKTDHAPLTNRKPSYLFGLLGLIPVVGVIAGLVLVFFGIKKFRDNWLIIVGIAAVVTSLLVHGFIIFSAKKMMNLNGQAFEMMSQSQLNGLIKNIEFYKIQNGTYPGDLHQLLIEDKQASIDDALQMGKTNTLYRYKKIGNKYTLFSAGPDGITGTSDDLFPQIIPYDTSKVGFIYPYERTTEYR